MAVVAVRATNWEPITPTRYMRACLEQQMATMLVATQASAVFHEAPHYCIVTEASITFVSGNDSSLASNRSCVDLARSIDEADSIYKVYKPPIALLGKACWCPVLATNIEYYPSIESRKSARLGCCHVFRNTPYTSQVVIILHIKILKGSST